MNLFKRRILGLTSYFRSAQEQLMPEYNKDTDFKVIKIPMSDYQFGSIRTSQYSREKVAETALIKRRKNQVEVMFIQDSVSSYRIFSRAFCNFVFP